MNFVNELNQLKEHLAQTPLVQRIRELEQYIDNNTQLSDMISSLKEQQKKMVNAKEFDQINQYKVYKREYEHMYQQIIDFPFVEEYIELLNEAHEELEQISYLIEQKINQCLEEK